MWHRQTLTSQYPTRAYVWTQIIQIKVARAARVALLIIKLCKKYFLNLFLKL